MPAALAELWIVAGRRSGKSIIAALIAVWATGCRAYPSLVPGEVGVFMVIASDKRQARVIKRYVLGLLRAHPSLEALIARETADAIWLTNGLCIEIHTARDKSVRGFTLIGAALDELAFWEGDDWHHRITRCSWPCARQRPPFPKRSSSGSHPRTAGRVNCGASMKNSGRTTTAIGCSSSTRQRAR